MEYWNDEDWSIGVLELWSNEEREYWNIGMMEFWVT
jgi:hypothetical protein